MDCEILERNKLNDGREWHLTEYEVNLDELL